MDEGFTSWSSTEVQAYYNQTLITPEVKLPLKVDHQGSYKGYYNLVKSGLSEPMTTYADHYETNFAFSVNSYSKGAIYVEQLAYIEIQTSNSQ